MDGRVYTLKENVETLLVMGLDNTEVPEDSGYYNDLSADFIVLLVIDHDAKTSTPIHINRDTITTINVLGVAGQKIGETKGQIALSYSYGNGRAVSCRNVSDAVSGLLMDVSIDNYMSLTMGGVPVLNDLVGGVEVTILEDFSDVDATMVQGETVKLTGEQALLYVRARQNIKGSSNEKRMERQRQYLDALFIATSGRAEGDTAFMAEVALKMGDYIASNSSLERLQEKFSEISDYTMQDIRTLEGENKISADNFMEFYAEEKCIRDMIIQLFYKLKL